jgi:hypothetical protein
MKAGMREFFSSPDPLVRNLLLSLPIWAIILMTYQIDSEYNNFYPGDSYDNLIFNTIFEFVGYNMLSELARERQQRCTAWVSLFFSSARSESSSMTYPITLILTFT